MNKDANSLVDRRNFLRGMTLGAAVLAVPGVFADELVRTPAQTAGPFYPDKLPLDTDNDLLSINGARTQAVGEITWLSGRILDARGKPMHSAVVEIWQVDNNGAYLHAQSGNRQRLDGNFQGFGRFLTGSSGEYLFRTIKPVPYGSRTPHIHFAVRMQGMHQFTTQCYVKGEPRNERDGVLNRIDDARAKASVIVPFLPLQASRTGELTARFDIALGFTPQA
ncbi:MAG: intradiol ring-cleavage dioxygenase [Gammaproteobacteria bacterium]|nr:intradiol ring-cleavage dioxygenase [Gammaproteobacteria bacterium]